MRSTMTNTTNILLSTVSVLMALIVCAPQGRCEVTQTSEGRLVALAPVRDYSRGINITAIQPVESLRDVRSEDIAKIIPDDLTPTSNGSLVAARIVDHSLSNFFNSPAIKHSDFGRTAHTVEKKLEGEASFGGDDDKSVKHVFKFQMKAAQTKAQLEYTGFTNAQLTYQISQSTMNFEVHEKLSPTTRVVYNHIAKPDDTRDVVSVRWIW